MNDRSLAGDERTMPQNKPDAMLGSGRLTAALWKNRDGESDGVYHFNIFAMDPSTGHVTQRFSSDDLTDLTQLMRILSLAISGEG